jgi:integrase
MVRGRGFEPLPLSNQISAKIIEHTLWMQKEGYRPATIKAAAKTLRAVGRRCDILTPEEIKGHLVKANYGENRRDKILGDLTRFYKWMKVDFYRPLSRRVETLPFIPLESEIDSLIGGLGPKLSAFTRLVKETGARPMEIFQLKWTDLDTESNTVSITPEKGSRPRRPRINPNTVASIMNQPRTSIYIFHNEKRDNEDQYRNFFRNFAGQRTRIARTLQNPRIRRISFKTLRHWKASTLYAKTKDLLLVKETLGHRSISSTMKYTHLIQFQDDDYVCKVAKTVGEAKTLVESGFEYVTDVDEHKLFRKRK